MTPARRLVAAVVVFAVLSVPPGAQAGITDPYQCSVDSFLVACPAGDLVFHSVMREVSGTPQNSPDETFLDLCGCAGARFGVPFAGDPYTLVAGCRPTTHLVMPEATADFPLRAGGVCSGASIALLTDGIHVITLGSLASPDQDGDLVVDAADRALLVAKLTGPYDPTADLNGDRLLSTADLELLDRHLGHAAEMPTGAHASTWGGLKSIYR